jgi:hypothetical protein
MWKSLCDPSKEKAGYVSPLRTEKIQKALKVRFHTRW